MRRITEAEARRLILSGEAGYWSVRSNPPIEHDNQTVVVVKGQFYLFPATKFRVKFLMPIGVFNGRMKGAHTIQIEDDIPIFGDLKDEMDTVGVRLSGKDFDNFGDNDERHQQN